MSAPTCHLLLVAWASAVEPAFLASDYGVFEVSRCDALADVDAALTHRAADLVLIHVDAASVEVQADSPALAELASDLPVVIVADSPTAQASLRLLAAGVQDVVPTNAIGEGGSALPRMLRFALERHARERAARKAASTDLLTGLPNQAQLVEHMSQLLALREREPAPMVAIALRVGGLAAAESALGREAANVLRRKVAVRLRAAMRAGDVVASTGPDRFAVLLPHVQSADDGTRVVEKLVAALSLPIGLAGRQVAVTLAAGIAQYPRDGKDAALLLRVACDAASLATPAQTADAASGGPSRTSAANDD